MYSDLRVRKFGGKIRVLISARAEIFLSAVPRSSSLRTTQQLYTARSGIP
jgi:membrane glycosyltransferase